MVKVTVEVHPDDYYEHFYQKRLRQNSAPTSARSTRPRSRSARELPTEEIVPIPKEMSRIEIRRVAAEAKPPSTPRRGRKVK